LLVGMSAIFWRRLRNCHVIPLTKAIPLVTRVGLLRRKRTQLF
jgi:hypothetical protein